MVPAERPASPRRRAGRSRFAIGLRGRMAALAGAGLLVLLSASSPWPAERIAATARPSEPILPIPFQSRASDPRVVLGDRLFNDPRLSSTGTTSCASCHDLSTNGATGNAIDTGIDGSPLRFNTPTVFNAALSFRLGWEGRYRDLKTHIEALLNNPALMDTTAEAAAERVREDPAISFLARRAYGRPLDREALLDALVAFERSLLTPNAPFDRWLRGEATAISDEAREGYEIFKSRGCVSCHQGVGVGGNLFQRQGVFHPLVPPPPEIVRVPSLRNVAATAPYFHDGSAATLPEAVGRMARAQLDTTLGRDEIDKLVTFLDTLTGSYRGTPVTAAP